MSEEVEAVGPDGLDTAQQSILTAIRRYIQHEMTLNQAKAIAQLGAQIMATIEGLRAERHPNTDRDPSRPKAAKPNAETDFRLRVGDIVIFWDQRRLPTDTDIEIEEKYKVTEIFPQRNAVHLANTKNQKDFRDMVSVGELMVIRHGYEPFPATLHESKIGKAIKGATDKITGKTRGPYKKHSDPHAMFNAIKTYMEKVHSLLKDDNVSYEYKEQLAERLSKYIIKPTIIRLDNLSKKKGRAKRK